MSFRPLALCLLLLLPATSGCGVMQVVDDVDDSHLVNAVPADERPTVLVRLEAGKAGDELLSAFHAPFSLPLFASVAYQQGTDHMSTRADYVLDMSVTRDTEVNGFTVFSVITLGAVPIPMWDVYCATVEVRDSFGKALGRTSASGEVTTLMWLGALPFNVAFSMLDPGIGRAFGLNASVYESERDELVEALVRQALLDANERFHFRRPGPRPFDGETAAENGK